MKVTKYNGVRYCINCREETDHTLIYLDRYLKAGKCNDCGDEFNNRENLLDAYMKDMFERFLSKPYRVTQQYSYMPTSGKKHMLISCELMKSFFSKPAREAHNLSQIWRKQTFNNHLNGHAT